MSWRQAPPVLYRTVTGDRALRAIVFSLGRRVGEVYQRGDRIEFQRTDDWWPLLEADTGELAALVPMVLRSDELTSQRSELPGYAPVLQDPTFLREKTRH